MLRTLLHAYSLSPTLGLLAVPAGSAGVSVCFSALPWGLPRQGQGQSPFSWGQFGGRTGKEVAQWPAQHHVTGCRGVVILRLGEGEERELLDG